ncbi:MAG: M48 family metalloprotease [Candidatus Acidiferrales bacterium]
MKNWFRKGLGALVGACLMAPFCAAQTVDQLSDKDKRKMEEIAQRPEVKERINAAWDNLRRQDMEYAYNVNTSSRLGELVGPQYADFRAKYGQLYDNPVLQGYVNLLGQRLVPKDSHQLYAFRLLLDPIPRAESLSTGTILISTGLVSALDNEAQLSYVLAHEIAHVENNHFYRKISNSILDEEFYAEKEKEVQTKRSIFSAAAAGAGAIAGGAAKGGVGAVMGAGIGYGAGSLAAHFLFRNKFEPTSWDVVYEDEADELGLKYMLDMDYDAREIPRLYARINRLVSADARVGLGFIGNPQRVKERTAHIQSVMAGARKADLDQRIKAHSLIVSGPSFSLLMSALRRDNGIIAMDYDLLDMAKDNLEEAANLRSNDPRVYQYLGKLMATTGRTPEDKALAIKYISTAIKLDAQRGAVVEPHLEMAIYLMAQNDPSKNDEALRELKTYVALYQRDNGGRVPSNMYILYDYAELIGDHSWFVPPATTVSTRNVEAIYVTPVNSAPATDTPTVVNRAVGAASEQPVVWNPNAPAGRPAAPATHKPAAPKPQ